MPPMIQRLNSGGRRRSLLGNAVRAAGRSYVRDAFGRFARTGSATGKQKARVLGRRARYLKSVNFPSGGRGARRLMARERSVHKVSRALGKKGWSPAGRKMARQWARSNRPDLTPRYRNYRKFTPSTRMARNYRAEYRQLGLMERHAKQANAFKRSRRAGRVSGGASALSFGRSVGRGGRALGDASFRGGASALRYGASAARHGSRARGGVSRALRATVRGATAPGISSLRRNRSARAVGRAEYKLIRSAGGGRGAARRVSKLQRGFVAGSIRTGAIKGGVKVPRRKRRAQAAVNAARIRRESPLSPWPYYR